MRRHSLRNGLRLIRGLLGAPGFLATVASHVRHAKLDPSVGGSGQHDFAVRIDALVLRADTAIASRALRFVTIGRSAPLAGREHAKLITIFRKTEEEYLRGSGLT
jgi:hypothetical protein